MEHYATILLEGVCSALTLTRGKYCYIDSGFEEEINIKEKLGVKYMKQIFLNYIKENQEIALSISLIFSFVVWIYRDCKVNIEANYNKKLKNIEDSITHLCRLESLLSFYIHQDKESDKMNKEIYLELYTQLGEVNYFFSDDLRTIVKEFYKDNNFEKLRTILKVVEIKIDTLRAEKNKLLFRENPMYIFNNALRLFNPLLSTFGILFVIVFFPLSIAYAYFQSTLYDQIRVIWLLFSVFFSLFTLYIMAKAWVKLDKREALLLSLAILTPLAALIIKEVAYISLFIQTGIFLGLERLEAKKKNIITKL